MASSFWLLWLSVMSSRVSLAYVSNSLLFMVEYYSIVWMYWICLSSHESMDFSIVRTLGLLWTVLLWTFMYKFVFIYLRHLPRKGIAGSCSNSMFKWGVAELFQNGRTNLHSHQWYIRVPIFLHLHQNLLLSFFDLAMQMDVKWHFIVALSCLSIIIRVLSIFSHADWPFVDLWRSVHSDFFFLASFLVGLFVFVVELHKNSLCILDTSPLSDVWFNIFYGVGCFTFVMVLFCSAKVFNFDFLVSLFVKLF